MRVTYITILDTDLLEDKEHILPELINLLPVNSLNEYGDLNEDILIISDSIVPEHETMFLFANDYDTKQLLDFFIKEEILVKQVDITDDLIMGRLKDNSIFQHTFGEGVNHGIAFDAMNRFLLKHTTVDQVLEKIIEHGLDKLNETDHIILKQKNPTE